MKHLKVFYVIVAVLLFAATAFAAGAKAGKSACIDCHRKVTPGVVQQFLEGKCLREGVDCSSCHGSDHKKMDDMKASKDAHPRNLRQAAIRSRSTVSGRKT